jgi:short-subunit dehydrogenase
VSIGMICLFDRHGTGVIRPGQRRALRETSDSELGDRAVLPGMLDRGTGAIVQMSSMGGRFTFPGVGAYSATKFALGGWSEALAKEVERFGIPVLIVEPGAFRTSLNGPGALLLSKPSPAYDDQIEPLRSAASLDSAKAELAAWERVGRSAVFD